MKRYFILPILGCLLLLCHSCQKDLDLYSGKASVYFSMFSTGLGLSQPIDSTVLSFAFEPLSIKDSVVVLKVNTLGPLSSTERRFKAVVDPQQTTAVAGEDYEVLADSYVVAAGQNTAELPVKVKRSAALKNKSRRLAIRLVASTDFELALTTAISRNGTSKSSALIHRIDFTDVIEQPANWYTAAYYFGKFSRKKLYLMNELTKVPLNQLTGNMTVAARRYVGSLTKKYLQEMAAAGTPVLEEDGSLMEMGPYII